MRRYAWLVAITTFACSSSPSDPSLFSQPTRIRVSPSAFLGDTPCSNQGGMRYYQATLYDVTEGLDRAFALPSSDLVACTADVEFQYVSAGRYYIAEVRAFDAVGLAVATPGAPVIIDEARDIATPRWETTCWGHDGVTQESLGLGGADGSTMGGAANRPDELGVRAFSKTIVTVRGCEPLDDSGTEGSTQVSISIDNALVDLTCGDGPDEVASFREVGGGVPSAGGAGGAGGASGSDTEFLSATCGDSLIVTAPPDMLTIHEVEGLNSAGDVIWTTSCQARTREGITVAATCNPARPL